MPDEAQLLDYVFSINFKQLTISLIVLALAALAIYAIIRKLQEITGIETKEMKWKRSINEDIKKLSQEIDIMKTQHEKDQKHTIEGFNEIKNSQQQVIKSLEKLSCSIEKNEIDSLRWTILDFANAVRNNRKYDIQAYNHILEIYDAYETLLQKNGLQNGRVSMAISLIKEKFEIGMRDGFPV